MQTPAGAPRPEPTPKSGHGAPPPIRVSLFLGAGASTGYWMPTTVELKEELAKKHAADEKEKGGGTGDSGGPDTWSDLLSASNGLDIEHVLLLADTIDKLYDTEAGRHLVKGSGQLGRQLEEVMRVGRAARREVFRRYAWDHDLDESADELLGPLVGMATALNGNRQVSIFTTNYDRAVEEFCEGRGLHMRDGFRLDTRTGRRVWAGNFGAGRGKTGKTGAPGTVRLYKLHGSLDWKYAAKHGVLRVDYDGASDSVHYSDTIVPPSLADKRGEIEGDPYKTLHNLFRSELESSDACIVVGFSFRDGPIADAFQRFAEQDDKTLIVVGPDARRDVSRRILEGQPGEGGQADVGVPVALSAAADGDRRRMAVVIEQKWTGITNVEIATRAKSVIEARHDLLPVHTYGDCTECTAKMTIDDMERHVAKHWYRREGEGAFLLKIAAHATGAPWMFVLVRPDAALGDLEKFLQAEWMPRHYPEAQHKAVRFGTRPLENLDPGTALSDMPGAELTAWCNDVYRLRVTVKCLVSAGGLHKTARALAVGEEPLLV